MSNKTNIDHGRTMMRNMVRSCKCGPISVQRFDQMSDSDFDRISSKVINRHFDQLEEEDNHV